jgi:hypothetical protein
LSRDGKEWRGPCGATNGYTTVGRPCGAVGVIRSEAFLVPPKGVDVKQFPEVGST